MRGYGYGFPRMSLLGSSVSRGNGQPLALSRSRSLGGKAGPGTQPHPAYNTFYVVIPIRYIVKCNEVIAQQLFFVNCPISDVYFCRSCFVEYYLWVICSLTEQIGQSRRG